MGDKCISIWNDFTGSESSDDEYLFEFRRFCTENSIKDVRFYFPRRSQRGNAVKIYNQFKLSLKKDSYSCQTLKAETRVTGNGECIDLLSLLDTETGKLVNLKFKGTFASKFANATCIVS